MIAAGGQPRILDAVAYKNGPKNQWRRTVWNIAHYHALPGVVLYLPGETDLDRAEATRRGFKPADLIAIERNEAVALRLRAKGTTTICGSLIDVLKSWPPHVPISVLVADLQCGLDPWVQDLAGICGQHPALAESVIVCNLQRGRDALGREWKPRGIHPEGDFSYFEGDSAANPHSRAYGFSLMVDRDPAMVRANECEKKIASLKESLHALGEANRRSPAKTRDELSSQLNKIKRNEAATSEAYREYEWVLNRLTRVHHPPAYRSTPKSPMFDSCVLLMAADAERLRAGWAPEGTLRLQVAAALALRTRKLRGELGGGHHKRHRTDH